MAVVSLSHVKYHSKIIIITPNFSTVAKEYYIQRLLR